ncbi:OapA protein [Testudinibacter sp. TR-2022]|uniref:LysM-like peptidoglycan-binding domain-containing protein n=1 Tax=Testudinibacter sp. TR-2022 TaxID=2585029 RepID=UPI00111ACBE2|nr:LysM-like peptidoglycan-binding domain-containing protein [Testudinibacter sp. TR-2022]TNH03651.1 OapA protein [Pasteurellaceae bacterium Phil31]TNH11368.1 OapA protein [Testudinibacter sp. TR-2022]TNH11872.1 OapA protein [Testudinibacter sp. TR-2022]TNH16127.1 OapA protein [Testudinibacter sp. TR-2022]TNH18250.1 OapA protein [Testudinibacter sp. TR-2022]
MTSENQNRSNAEATAGEKQNQLKFEFSNMEPITPKKPIEEKPSFFDKAKGLLPKREHKEESMSTTNLPPHDPQPVTESAAQIETTAKSAVEPITTDHANSAHEPLSNRLKKPETWGILNRLPAKHRRLFIALLALILVLLIFFWLKPSSTTTVDALQAQNSNTLPIEFQSLNQSEEEQINQPNEQSNNQNNALLPQPNTVGDSNAQTLATAAATQAAAVAAGTVAQSANAQTAPSQTTATQQATTPPRYEAPKEQATRTPAKSQPTTTTKTTTVKPTTAPKQAAAPAKPAADNTTSGNNRTLTIPQGVSLMQVFRNNNLNIADVNAMTKANGGEKALSSFKAGDKVTIQVNSQGRVSRLTLQNGSTFIRNNDGSYQYKK